MRVNLVAPGPVDGPRLEAVLEEPARMAGLTLGQQREDYVGQSPLRGLAEPAQEADAVVFRAGAGSTAMTGEDLNVSAGITMH